MRRESSAHRRSKRQSSTGVADCRARRRRRATAPTKRRRAHRRSCVGVLAATGRLTPVRTSPTRPSDFKPDAPATTQRRGSFSALSRSYACRCQVNVPAAGDDKPSRMADRWRRRPNEYPCRSTSALPPAKSPMMAPFSSARRFIKHATSRPAQRSCRSKVTRAKSRLHRVISLATSSEVAHRRRGSWSSRVIAGYVATAG